MSWKIRHILRRSTISSCGIEPNGDCGTTDTEEWAIMVWTHPADGQRAKSLATLVTGTCAKENRGKDGQKMSKMTYRL